ncbi:MAG: hypothetical protein ACHBN1_09440 [Heteroscytonema crispum UTEX LB 1556]
MGVGGWGTTNQQRRTQRENQLLAVVLPSRSTGSPPTKSKILIFFARIDKTGIHCDR